MKELERKQHLARSCPAQVVAWVTAAKLIRIRRNEKVV